MGPSGSGKSTLMNIIGLLDRPTSGDYSLNGTQVEDLKEKELAKVRNEEIGFVFQQFFPCDRSRAGDGPALCHPGMLPAVCAVQHTGPGLPG